MTQEEKVKHWIDIADRDFVVATSMLKMKHYLYAGFMCQQATEKLLKGYLTKVKDDTPPLIHDLLKLAKRAEFYDVLDEKQRYFIAELTAFYIEARYTDYKSALAKSMTKEKTQSILTQTKELLQWIKEKM